MAERECFWCQCVEWAACDASLKDPDWEGPCGWAGDDWCDNPDCTTQQALFDALAHGDEAHQLWLRGAIRSHVAGEPVPAPPAAAPPTDEPSTPFRHDR